MTATLLEARELRVTLGPRRSPVQAVAGVDLAIAAGEILGLAGESGCGKTTLARTLLGLQRETSGTILLEGATVSGVAPTRARQIRRAVQYVHQDAGAALDPWWSIRRCLGEALVIAGDRSDPSDRIDAALAAVGLDPAMQTRHPHELSGGQLRRVGLARILLLAPRLVILDEPTSGLDMSVQATVLTLLRKLRAERGLAYLFISHDLGVLHRFCDRVAVMYAGCLLEIAPAAALFATPRHPYTRALLAAAPSLDPDRALPPALPGEPGAAPGIGCVFANRCPQAEARCRREAQPLVTQSARSVACWKALSPV